MTLRRRLMTLLIILVPAGCSDGNEPETDTTPPAVSITSPDAGAVSGVVTISAAASDASGTKGVDFYLNGGLLGPRDVTAPYEIEWDTGAAGAGTFTIWAIAFDNANLGATSAEVTVTTSAP